MYLRENYLSSAYLYVDVSMVIGMNYAFPANSVDIAEVTIFFYPDASSEDVSETSESYLYQEVHVIYDEGKVLQ